MMQAIEEYIDRHNTVPGGEGPKDLRTLEACGAEKLYQGIKMVIKHLGVTPKRDLAQLKSRRTAESMESMNT